MAKDYTTIKPTPVNKNAAAPIKIEDDKEEKVDIKPKEGDLKGVTEALEKFVEDFKEIFDNLDDSIKSLDDNIKNLLNKDKTEGVKKDDEEEKNAPPKEEKAKPDEKDYTPYFERVVSLLSNLTSKPATAPTTTPGTTNTTIKESTEKQDTNTIKEVVEKVSHKIENIIEKIQSTDTTTNTTKEKSETFNKEEKERSSTYTESLEKLINGDSKKGETGIFEKPKETDSLNTFFNNQKSTLDNKTTEISKIGKSETEGAAKVLEGGGTVPDGGVAIVGDKPGKDTSDSEEVVVNRGGDIQVLSNEEAKQAGFLNTGASADNSPKNIIPKRAGGFGSGVAQGLGSREGAQQATSDILGGISGSAQAVLGLIPVIGEVAGAMITAFESVANWALKLAESFNKLTVSLSDYSKDIQGAMANVELATIQQDIRMAERLGPDLAKVYEESNMIWLDIKEILMDLAEPLLAILVPVLEMIRDFINFIKPFFQVIAQLFKYGIRVFTVGADEAREELNEALQRIIRAIERGEEDSSDFNGIPLLAASASQLNLPTLGTGAPANLSPL